MHTYCALLAPSPLRGRHALDSLFSKMVCFLLPFNHCHSSPSLLHYLRPLVLHRHHRRILLFAFSDRLCLQEMAHFLPQPSPLPQLGISLAVRWALLAGQAAEEDLKVARSCSPEALGMTTEGHRSSCWKHWGHWTSRSARRGMCPLIWRVFLTETSRKRVSEHRISIMSTSQSMVVGDGARTISLPKKSKPWQCRIACVALLTSRNRTCACPRILGVFIAVISMTGPYVLSSIYRFRFRSDF